MWLNIWFSQRWLNSKSFWWTVMPGSFSREEARKDVGCCCYGTCWEAEARVPERAPALAVSDEEERGPSRPLEGRVGPPGEATERPRDETSLMAVEPAFEAVVL